MKGILKIYSRVVLFLFPLFFLPVIYNSFALGKVSFLVGSAFIGLILWLVGLVFFKDKVIRWNKILIWFLVLMIWIIVSWLRLDSGVMMRVLLNQSGLGVFGGLFLWMFLWMQIADEGEIKKQFSVLTASGIVVAILSLIVFMIPAAKLPLVWPKNNPFLSIGSGWSITGSLVGEIIFFLVLAGYWLGRLLKKIKERVEISDYLKEAVGVIFFGLLLFLDIYKFIKLGWDGLDFRSTWIIAVENLKSNPVLGIGVGNFYQAFQSFKPASFNLTKVWSLGFNAGSMLWLTLWTELGLGALLLIVLGLVSLIKNSKKKGIKILLGFSLLTLISPPAFLVSFLLVWLIVLSGAFQVKESKVKLVVGESNFNIMPYILALLGLVLVGFGSYWMARILIADGYWKQSLMATSKDDGAGTYSLQIKAIGMNPNMADYRAIYSQTNLALAQNFLGKEEVSEEERQKGTVLVQQAVREGQAAVSLDGNNSKYWLNLANIYRSLIGLVDGADQWSLQAYQQAIILEENNPLTKLDLGGLFYASKNYESADRLFEEAVLAKNNHANSWYNWAHSAKEMNKLSEAVNRLEQAVMLVPVDSGDYDKASQELVEWKKELDDLVAKNKAMQEEQNKAREAENLNLAEPIPEVNEENKIEIPKEELPVETDVEATPGLVE